LRARRCQVGGGVHPQAHSPEREHQQLADIAFVVDDQGASGGGHGELF